MTTMVTEDEYKDAVESSMGFCTECRSFTRDTTEPDAEGYDCPDCDRPCVVGAELAMIMGAVTFP